MIIHNTSSMRITTEMFNMSEIVLMGFLLKKNIRRDITPTTIKTKKERLT